MEGRAAAAGRVMPHPDAAGLELTAVLFALSDPSRLAIVRGLADGPMDVADCAAVTGEIPKSSRSHHLKTLREAGLVRNDPNGRERRLTLRRADVDDRFPGLLESVLRRA